MVKLFTEYERKVLGEKRVSQHQCVADNLNFDDVALATVCLFADVRQCTKAKKVFDKVKKECKPEFTGVSKTDLEREVDWKHIYNFKVNDYIDGEGFSKEEDSYGAYGWTDNSGNKHFGDDRGLFPLFADEESLKKALE